jgi:hypothetical protein
MVHCAVCYRANGIIRKNVLASAIIRLQQTSEIRISHALRDTRMNILKEVSQWTQLLFHPDEGCRPKILEERDFALFDASKCKIEDRHILLRSWNELWNAKRHADENCFVNYKRLMLVAGKRRGEREERRTLNFTLLRLCRVQFTASVYNIQVFHKRVQLEISRRWIRFILNAVLLPRLEMSTMDDYTESRRCLTTRKAKQENLSLRFYL